jgi:hypothetical protein
MPPRSIQKTKRHVSAGRSIGVGDVNPVATTAAGARIAVAPEAREQSDEPSVSAPTPQLQHRWSSEPAEPFGQPQAQACGPCRVALLGRQEAGCRCQRANVDGVTGRKRVEPASRRSVCRASVRGPFPIGTFLVEDLAEARSRQAPLEERGRLPALLARSWCGTEATNRWPRRAQEVFIGAPGYSFGRLFRIGPGMGGDDVGDV